MKEINYLTALTVTLTDAEAKQVACELKLTAARPLLCACIVTTARCTQT